MKKEYLALKISLNTPYQKGTEIALIKFKNSVETKISTVELRDIEVLEFKGDDIVYFSTNSFRYNFQMDIISYPYSLTKNYFNNYSFEDYESAKLAFNLLEV